LLARDHAAMVHDALDRALSTDMAGDNDGRFALRIAPEAPGLTGREADVFDRLAAGPAPVSALLRTRLEAAALDRLVTRGLVMIAGVTPSDASHVLGRLADWDGTAALKALRLLARRRNGAGQRIAATPEALAQAVIDQLTAQTADCLLEAALSEDGFESPETLVRHTLLRAAVAGHRGAVALSARLAVPVVGLGASAPFYYGAVGEALGARMILPDHAGVANAIGAVVGQISMRATGLVTSPSEGRYTAHLPEGLRHFSDRDTALETVETALAAEASARARAAGAEDLRLSQTRDIREAEIEGRILFIEAEITVTAEGRPRVAHVTGSEAEG
jgi:N-methylhydantoinase A/oxoprolinase/acetone carboxylase beta subunit